MQDGVFRGDVPESPKRILSWRARYLSEQTVNISTRIFGTGGSGFRSCLIRYRLRWGGDTASHEIIFDATGHTRIPVMAKNIDVELFGEQDDFITPRAYSAPNVLANVSCGPGSQAPTRLTFTSQLLRADQVAAASSSGYTPVGAKTLQAVHVENSGGLGYSRSLPPGSVYLDDIEPFGFQLFRLDELIDPKPLLPRACIPYDYIGVPRWTFVRDNATNTEYFRLLFEVE